MCVETLRQQAFIISWQDLDVKYTYVDFSGSRVWQWMAAKIMCIVIERPITVHYLF